MKLKPVISSLIWISSLIIASTYAAQRVLASTSSNEPFDRIVVIVNEKIITQSDIEIEQILSRKIPSISKILQQQRIQNPQDGATQIYILNNFAGDINFYQPSSEQIAQRYQEFKNNWSVIEEYNQFFQKYGWKNTTVFTYIRKLLIAENYIQKNIGIPFDDFNESAINSYAQWLSNANNRINIREVEPFE